MNLFKNKRCLCLLSGTLAVLFNLAVANTLLYNYNLVDILVGSLGIVIFLLQLITANSHLKMCFRNKSIPVLSPWILKCRVKYGKGRFFLLADIMNLRLIAIVVLMMIFYSHPFDVSWWLYLVNLTILLFIRAVYGRMLWIRYGEYASPKNVPVKMETLQ